MRISPEDSYWWKEDQELREELKLLDKIGFLYEISQSSPKGIDASKGELIAQMYARQRDALLDYATLVHLDQQQVQDFLEEGPPHPSIFQVEVRRPS